MDELDANAKPAPPAASPPSPASASEPVSRTEPVEAGALPPGDPRSSWQHTVFWMFTLALVAASGLYMFKSCRDLPGEAVDLTANKAVQIRTNLSRTLAQLAETFNHRAVTVSMNSTGTTLESMKHFQFKKVTQTEIFTHTDRATTGFGYIALPEVIVEARAPVEYAYYLDLDAPWRLVVRDRQVHVLTPDIQFNRPAVDVSRIEYEVKKGSVFRDTEAARESLKKSITSLAYMKGLENLRLVRAGGREPVEEFVKQWLLHSFADGTNYQVKVYFPGEKNAEGLDFTSPE
jgi:hypothetical protein